MARHVVTSRRAGSCEVWRMPREFKWKWYAEEAAVHGCRATGREYLMESWDGPGAVERVLFERADRGANGSWTVLRTEGAEVSELRAMGVG